MRFGSLFTGIGGLDLGLERAGMTCAWQVEIDPYARRVLERHWPGVPRFTDVCAVRHPPAVDLLCGGFPCQDLSDASRGRGDGLDGKRSGLWWEFDRLIGDALPRWVVVENVDGAAWKKWVPVVRRALHGRLYASVPLRVRAEDVGAPFKGSRVFVVAQAYGKGKPARKIDAQMAELLGAAEPRRQDWGQPSPRALGVADGVPHRMDRLRGCGNAVVPACAEFVGRLILAAAARDTGVTASASAT